MSMTDQEMGMYVARCAFQVRMLIEGHFLNQGVQLRIEVMDGYFNDENKDWLFAPGYAFHSGKGVFYLSLRGHISRLQSSNPYDIARWIESDAGLQAKLSKNDDIVAYETSTSKELIDQVLEICNSASLPH